MLIKEGGQQASCLVAKQAQAVEIMNNEEFRQGKLDTGFIERHPELLAPGEVDIEPALIAAALAVDDVEETTETEKAPQSNWKLLARKASLSGGSLI